MRDLGTVAPVTTPGTATQDLAARVAAWCEDVMRGARHVTPAEREALARCAAAIAASDRAAGSAPPHTTTRA